MLAWSVYIILATNPRNDFEGVIGPAINACYIVVAYACYTYWLEWERRGLADGFVQTLYGGKDLASINAEQFVVRHLVRGAVCSSRCSVGGEGKPHKPVIAWNTNTP